MIARAYITNTDSDDISVVDLHSRHEITRISIGGSPRGSVRFDPQRNFGYVSNCAGNTISVLDLNRNREVAKILVGLAPRGLTLSPDGRHAFVSNSGDNSLSVVDLAERREVRRLAMGENPRHMAVLPKVNRLLVTQWGSDSVANIDLAGGAVTASSLASTPVGEGSRPYSVVATADGATAYVANTQADHLSVLDVATGLEKARIRIGFGGRAAVLTPDERYAFVSVENSNELVVVETATESVVKRLEVGPSPRGVALSRSRMEVYSSAFSRSTSVAFGDIARNTLTVVDVKDPLGASVAGHIRVGLGPCSVSVLE
jgi:YVTN family beta-propeller protein